MAPPLKRKPLKIDERKSVLWAISGLASVGVGIKGPLGVGLGVFDLVNRLTGRAHRLTLKSVGGGAGLPVSASSQTPYGNFTASRPVRFQDFNGIGMEVGEVNLGAYSWNEVTLRDGSTPNAPVLGKTKMKGWGPGIPGVGDQHGITQVLFSDEGRSTLEG